MVPICPRESGIFHLKILVKFEEERKVREIDVKRYLVKFKVSLFK